MILYKYLRKEHLLKFKADGSILINTLYNLREIEHEPIRDALEGHRGIKIRSDEKPLRLSGKEFHKMLPMLEMNKQAEKKIIFDIDNGAQFNMQIANAFVFCTSLELNRSLYERFGYDAYYKITKPMDFAEVVYEKLNQVVTIKYFKLDVVKYADKPIIMTNSNKDQILTDPDNQYLSTCFTKPKRFSAEQEFRMVFIPQSAREIEQIILTCPKLKKCCKLQ
jgi:hypothetical protein